MNDKSHITATTFLSIATSEFIRKDLGLPVIDSVGYLLQKAVENELKCRLDDAEATGSTTELFLKLEEETDYKNDKLRSITAKLDEYKTESPELDYTLNSREDVSGFMHIVEAFVKENDAPTEGRVSLRTTL